MALKKWSQAEVVFSTTSTTKICLIDGADPENKLISVQDLLNYITSGYVLTKEAVEAVLTGNITSHTHSQYLTAITKQMVESVLTGTITSHNHNVSNIIGAVSQTDLSIHAADSTHLTLEQLTFLNNLMITGGLTSEQVEILDLLSTDVDNNLIVSTNLIVEGSITAYSIGDPSIINYDMLNNWIDYSPTMTNWVISAPLIYELYTNLNSTISALDLKVDVVRQILPGLGLSGGGTLDNDVTLSLNIENLSLNSIIEDDYIAFYRTDGNHYKGLVSDLPFINSLLQIYTPTYSNPNSISGGGLQGGGLLTNNLYLELDLNSLDTYSGLIEEALDYLVVYDNSTSLHKKLSISNLPKKAEWGNITGLITDQLDLISLITNNDLNSRRVIGGDGIYITNNGYLDQDITVTLDISKLDTQSILSTDYLPFWRTGNDQFRGTVSDLASLLSAYQGWYFRSENNVGNQIGTYQITESSSATIKEGTNITITQVDGIITINAATTGTTYSAGTGLLLNSTTFNHLNSVTPQTIQGIYPITIDAEGHISTYGTAVTSLKNPNSIILKFDTGITENTNLYTYDGSSAKVIDIKSGNGILLTKSSNSITVNHADTSSITNVTSSENTFISAISFDAYGHVTARSTESINFNVSSNYAFSNMMISSDSGYTWGIANTNTTQSSESSSDTLILVNGNKINLYTNTISGVDAIKLEHQFTTRTNTTSVLSPSSGDSFTVIDSLVSDSTGHITTVNTKTVTLPIIAAISSVSSVSADQLIVYNGTTTPQLAIVTASVANGSLALATGGQIYSFVTGLGYTSNVGTVTSVSSLNSNHLVVTNSTTAPLLEIITDAIINGGTALATGDQIYDFVINLGYTSNTGTVTAVNSGNGMDFTSFTTSGTIVLGTPSNLVKSSINNVTANSHTHLVDLSTWNLEDLGNVVDLPGVNQYLYYNGTSWLTSSLDSYWTVNSGCLITSGTNYSVTLGSQTAYTTAKLYVQGADTAEGLLVRAALLDYRAFGVNNYDDVSLFDVTGDGKIYMHNITEASTSQVLYYDTTTKLITYGLSQPFDIPSLPPKTTALFAHDLLAFFDISTGVHRKIALYELEDYLILEGFLSEAPEDGNTYGRKDGAWAAVSGGGTTNHAALTNLDYAVSGHTGFVSTATAQTISGEKTFSSNPKISNASEAYISAKSTGASTNYTGFIIYDQSNVYQAQLGYDNLHNTSYVYAKDFLEIAVGTISLYPNEATIARFTTEALWLKDIATTPATPSAGFGGFYVKADKPYFISDAGTEYDLTATGSITETDPVFTASAAAGITATNISNWNTAYGWGNHATAGYITDAPSDGTTYGRKNGAWAANAASQWTSDTYGISYTAGNIGIGSASHSQYPFYIVSSSVYPLLYLKNTNASGYGAYISGGDGEAKYILTLGDYQESFKFRFDAEGHMFIRPSATPSTDATYGKLWMSSTDNLLYFKDKVGNVYDLTASGGSVGTLDQVLTAGNTSTNTITTGNATILGASPVLNISATGTGIGIINFKENTSTTRASIVAQTSGDLDLFPKSGASVRLYGYSSDNVFKINSTGFYLEGLDAGTTSNIIYWNSTTSELTYGSAQVETQFEKLGANYTFSSTVGGIPATGTIRINNASLSGLTEMYVYETDANSLSRTTELYSLASGHWISLRDNNGNWVRFKVNSVTDNGTFATISLSGGLQSNGSIANSAAVVLDFLFLPGSGGSMVYPGAGIPVSTGLAWGTSKTAPSGALVGTTDNQALTNKSINGVTLTTGGSATSFLNASGTYTTPSGASLWTDAGTYTYLTSTTDNVLIGTSTDAGPYKLQVNGSARIGSTITIGQVGSVSTPASGYGTIWSNNDGTDKLYFTNDNGVQYDLTDKTFSKSITIESPTSTEDISMFYTDEAITITKMTFVCVGLTPSVTCIIRQGLDRSSTGTAVVTSGTTATSTTTGNIVTSFNDATVPANSFIWLETTASTGTINSLNITIKYTKD